MSRFLFVIVGIAVGLVLSSIGSLAQFDILSSRISKPVALKQDTKISYGEETLILPKGTAIFLKKVYEGQYFFELYFTSFQTELAEEIDTSGPVFYSHKEAN
jgi:hypothetical protein